MPKCFKKHPLTAAMLLTGVLFSPAGFASANDTAVFPDISNKNVLVGFWHNWDGKSDGYQKGTSATMDLASVPEGYDVVTVAFMEGNGIPTFKPYNKTDSEFRADVAKLNARGQAVLLSLGGALAHIELKQGDAAKFADELVRLVELYGFDGLDIDLEGGAIGAGYNGTEIPAALKIVKGKYPKFIISMAPEFPHLRVGGAYQQLIQSLSGYYDFISPQYYNQAGDGVSTSEGYFAQNNDEKKAEFLFHLTDSIIHGKNGFIQIPASKFVIGLPSNPDAANNGYAKKETDVRSAWEKLAAQGTPIKGLMTWSINWDAGHSANGNNYGNEFVNRYAPLVHESSPGEPDTEAPSQPGKPSTVTSTGQVALSWSASQDNIGVTQYYIYRNGEKVATTALPQYTDRAVRPDTRYEYFVVASDKENNLSAPSQVVTVTTDKEELQEEDQQKPSIPSALKASSVGQNSLILSWQASTDNVGVKHYQIYRNGVQISTSALASFADSGLKAATSYQYQVVAVDTSDNASDKSQILMVTTQAEETTPGEYPNYREGASYSAGDIVRNNGSLYQCKPWPYTGWCAGAAWAYAPGAGQHWQQAWEAYKG
ncbi:hypothetical protein L465_00375 [Enterobacter sp. BIDMC 29]|uniref:glycosyl hydrolase family 18 protein n=1 Tax=Enterobacter sp. BIDMC 29 TaxID=1329841 RepID=UPI0004479BBA|nr:glycosyl hydrolase family 18 protein [Enterobacter sp. BIDMC 29]EUM16561.1 hypothetical protein L465_00375 [Enterobacter sp. BIDMC 29]